jgi:uncharacterized protein with GYD domain
MPIYITLINYTEQGIKNIKDSPVRLDAAREAIEKAGCKILSFHWTLGQYDAIAISEAPNAEVYTSLALAIAGQGNARTATLRAFNQEEMGRILSNIP